MSTNSLESGGVLGGSSRPKLPVRADLQKSNSHALRNTVRMTIGVAVVTVGGVLENANDRPVTTFLSKKMHDAWRAVFPDDKYSSVEAGTPKESIDLPEIDLGDGLTCKGTVIFNSYGEHSAHGDQYSPSIVLTISGLPPHPNGVECKINLACGSGYSPKVEGQQRTRIVKTSMAGFGGKVDPETRGKLLEKLGTRTVSKAEGGKLLDSLIHGPLSGYENLAHIRPEDLPKLYDAVIANAAQTPEEPEEKPLIASFER